MKKKSLDNKGNRNRPAPEDTEIDIIRYIDKRKEENNALKKIISNLNISALEGKSQKKHL